MLSWKGSMGITQSSSAPALRAQSPTLPWLSKPSLHSDRLGVFATSPVYHTHKMCLNSSGRKQPSSDSMSSLCPAPGIYSFLSHPHRLSRIISLIFKSFPMHLLDSEMNENKQRQSKGFGVSIRNLHLRNCNLVSKLRAGIPLTALGGSLLPYFLWPAKL